MRGRPRIHITNAERQRAYHQRNLLRNSFAALSYPDCREAANIVTEPDRGDVLYQEWQQFTDMDRHDDWYAGLPGADKLSLNESCALQRRNRTPGEKRA